MSQSENHNSTNKVVGNDERAILIKEFLNDMVANEKAFIESLVPGQMTLRHTLLKSLFETSLAKSKISANRDAIRTAFQHLSEMQSMAESLQDAIQRHFGFHQFLNPSNADVSIELDCVMCEDIDPFTVKLPEGRIVTVPDHLHEKLYEQGVVSHLSVTYPRADRYGIPQEATNKGGLRWLWDMGFRVSPDLTVSARDSGDDGMARAQIRIHIDSALLQEILQHSE